MSTLPSRSVRAAQPQPVRWGSSRTERQNLATRPLRQGQMAQAAIVVDLLPRDLSRHTAVRTGIAEAAGLAVPSIPTFDAASEEQVTHHSLVAMRVDPTLNTACSVESTMAAACARRTLG